MAALRRQIPGSYGRPKWRQRDITAEGAAKLARLLAAREQRMRIERLEPGVEALRFYMAAIYRITGQPVPPGLRDIPAALRLVRAQQR